jgi:hypothetical protein
LGEAQRREEILNIREFDFPFPKIDIIPREGIIILWLQGFNVISIVGLNSDKTRIRDLAIHVFHIGMYIRVQVWLKTGDGMGS